jgi:hypothetical protein
LQRAKPTTTLMAQQSFATSFNYSVQTLSVKCRRRCRRRCCRCVPISLHFFFFFLPIRRHLVPSRLARLFFASPFPISSAIIILPNRIVYAY